MTCIEQTPFQPESGQKLLAAIDALCIAHSKKGAFLEQSQARHALLKEFGDYGHGMERSGEHRARAEAADEIAGLRTKIDDCAAYLKEGETPAQRIEREIADADAALSLLVAEKRETESLRAQVAQYKADAERLDYVLRKLPGSILRSLIGTMSDTGDIDEFRAAIDKARGK